MFMKYLLVIMLFLECHSTAFAQMSDALQDKANQYIASGIKNGMSAAFRRRQEAFDFAETYLNAKYVGQSEAISSLLSIVKPWYLYGEPGMRKVLQLGPPSTGKSAVVADLMSVLGLRKYYRSVDLADFAPGSIDFDGKKILDTLIIQDFSKLTILDLEQMIDSIAKTGTYSVGRQVFTLEEFQLLSNLDPFSGLEKANNSVESLWNLFGSNGKLLIGNFLAERLDRYVRSPEIYTLNMTVAQAQRLLNKMGHIRQIEVDFSQAIFVCNANIDRLLPGADTGGFEDEAALDMVRRAAEQVTDQDISSALRELFSARSISRLGTVYAKYLPPTAENLRSFIRQQLTWIGNGYENTRTSLKLKKVSVEFDDAVVEAVLRRVMFTGAGFRQAISLITTVAIDPIGKLFDEMLKDGLKSRVTVRIAATLDAEQNMLLTVLEGSKAVKNRTYSLEMKNLRLDKSAIPSRAEKISIAAHEAGHATISLATKLIPPIAIKGTSASSGAGGYIIPSVDDPFYDRTAQGNLDRLATLLGGYAAEKLVMGTSTAGVSKDFEMATELARNMATNWGMSPDGNLVAGAILGNDKRDTAAMEVRMQQLLEAALKQAEQILIREQAFFRAMTKELVERRESNPQRTLEIMQETWSDSNEVTLALTGQGRGQQMCGTLEDFLNGMGDMNLGKVSSSFASGF
jgi:hypothetical protein